MNHIAFEVHALRVNSEMGASELENKQGKVCRNLWFYLKDDAPVLSLVQCA